MANTLSSIRSGVADGRRRLSGTAGAIPAILAWPGHCYRTWRERRALARLDDRMLKDIGLSRGDVYRETTRGFFDPPALERTRRRNGLHAFR